MVMPQFIKRWRERQDRRNRWNQRVEAAWRQWVQSGSEEHYNAWMAVSEEEP